MQINMKPIGYVRNERIAPVDDHWGNVVSEIILGEDHTSDSLKGIEQYSHVEIIYHFHLADPLKIIRGSKHPRERLDLPDTGIFAQRAKDRPNHIGTCICMLIEVNNLRITVQGLDAINHTPVLDIKPVMKEFLPGIQSIRQPSWNSELMKNYWK